MIIFTTSVMLRISQLNLAQSRITFTGPLLWRTHIDVSHGLGNFEILIKGERLQKLEESKRTFIKSGEKDAFVGTAEDDVAPPGVSVEMIIVRSAPGNH